MNDLIRSEVINWITFGIRLIVSKLSLLSVFFTTHFSDQYGQPLMPDDHDKTMAMLPCDNSDASIITSQDKSRSGACIIFLRADSTFQVLILG